VDMQNGLMNNGGSYYGLGMNIDKLSKKQLLKLKN